MWLFLTNMVEKPIFKAWPPSHGIHGCPMARGRTLARTSILHFPFDLLVNRIQKNKIKPVILQRACVCVCVSVCLSLHAHTNHVEAMAVSDNWDHIYIYIYISTKNKRRIWERERGRERTEPKKIKNNNIYHSAFGCWDVCLQFWLNNLNQWICSKHVLLFQLTSYF